MEASTRGFRRQKLLLAPKGNLPELAHSQKRLFSKNKKSTFLRKVLNMKKNTKKV